MSLYEFLTTLEKLNIDFEDIVFVYADSKTERPFYQLMDDSTYDILCYDILENHATEVEYLYSFLTDELVIVIDRASVEKVIKDYKYDIMLGEDYDY